MPLSPSKTPDELVEEGVGLIAAGLFRSRTRAKSCADAVLLGSAAITTLQSMLMDFRRLHSREMKTENDIKELCDALGVTS